MTPSERNRSSFRTPQFRHLFGQRIVVLKGGFGGGGMRVESHVENAGREAASDEVWAGILDRELGSVRNTFRCANIPAHSSLDGWRARVLF